jgi:CheY-like chemotaxis protein/HPt (histidine-containing phosphotransfer) domain-containing protein
VLRRYLPTPPLTLSMAVNGRAALEAAARDWPDVVFLDLEMPVMDGYEAARRLREMERAENRKRCIIVAISSNDGEAIVQRALASGCDHYLVKPAPREVLWRILAGTAAEPDDQLTAHEKRAKIPAEESDAVLIDPDLEASLAGFLESRRKLLDEMPEALAANDRAAFSRLAHKLAGGFALYGFGWAAQRCRALERDADKGDAKKLRKGVAAVCAHLSGASIRIKNGVKMETK